MSKAFTRELDADDDDEPQVPVVGAVKNYITPAGFQKLRAEWLQLMDVERPKMVEIVHWAASNGDRSENGDYLYGKKRLREIDRRIRFLTQRIDCAVPTDPSVHAGNEQIFFGATVQYAEIESGAEHTVTILGIDEADNALGQVSWVSPIARALLRTRVGDVTTVHTPAGPQEIEILSVTYPAAESASGA